MKTSRALTHEVMEGWLQAAIASILCILHTESFDYVTDLDNFDVVSV